MVNTLSGSVCAYRKETVKPRFIRIDEVMALLDVTQDEAMDIALAAGARYQLAKIIYFDSRLPQIIDNLRNNDLLIINADHGCDPTFKGTDHTREYIPVIAYSKNCKNGVDLGILNSFSDIGATIAEIFGVKISNGESFLNKIL